MPDPYIPRADVAAREWMSSFANVIAADTARYAISTAESASLSSAVGAFADALRIATKVATRTAVTVSAKDEARNAAEQLCRHYAKLIKFNMGISVADKVRLRINPPNPGRSRVGVPQTLPWISIIAATPYTHTLKYRDSLNSNRIAKPFGATQILLFRAINDVRAIDPEQAQFYRGFTRNPMPVEFKAAHDGKIATYFARWANRRGEVGWWSLPVSMRIAA